MRAKFSSKQAWLIGAGLGVLLTTGLLILKFTTSDSRSPELSVNAVIEPPAAEALLIPSGNSIQPESASAPDLTLAVNGVGEAEVFQGWPILVEVSLLHPDAMKQKSAGLPVVLAAKSGPWSNAIRLVAKKTSGEEEAWPFHLALIPPETLSLNAETSGELAWWLAPEDTSKLEEGVYELGALIDTTNTASPNGWKGRTQGRPVSIRISREPSPLSPAVESKKLHLFASYFLLRGDSKQALAKIDELLQKQPHDIDGLEFQGDILAAEGKAKEALDSYGRAIDAFFKKYSTKGEPPHILFTKQGEQLHKLSRQHTPVKLDAPVSSKPDQPALTEHSLWADTAAGKREQSPFPALSKKVYFAWKLPSNAATEPIEARWIATNTNGIAPANYRIATVKSEANKANGEFTLVTPHAGLPVGDYRLELWQSGKQLHVEKFRIGE